MVLVVVVGVGVRSGGGVHCILIYQSGSSGIHVNSGRALNHCKIIMNSRLEVRQLHLSVCLREWFFCFETIGSTAKKVVFWTGLNFN